MPRVRRYVYSDRIFKATIYKSREVGKVMFWKIMKNIVTLGIPLFREAARARRLKRAQEAELKKKEPAKEKNAK